MSKSLYVPVYHKVTAFLICDLYCMSCDVFQSLLPGTLLDASVNCSWGLGHNWMMGMWLEAGFCAELCKRACTLKGGLQLSSSWQCIWAVVVGWWWELWLLCNALACISSVPTSRLGLCLGWVWFSASLLPESWRYLRHMVVLSIPKGNSSLGQPLADGSGSSDGGGNKHWRLLVVVITSGLLGSSGDGSNRKYYSTATVLFILL